MADEATENQAAPPAAAAAPPEAAVVATPESDPTPAQVESKSVVGQLTDEIDDLWSKIENAGPKAPPRQQAPDPEPVAETPAPTAEAEPEPAAEAPPAIDQAEIERQAEERVRQRIAAEQEAERKAAERIQQEQQSRAVREAYIGTQSDYDAVNEALREANATGDYSRLDGLDVRLPNGKRVSEVKGQKGLTPEEAASVLNSWDLARRYEDAMGDQKVGRILDLWNAEVMSALNDPDVDAAAVTQHKTPGQQMDALKQSLRERITKRLTEAHTAEIKARDAEIARLNERVNSLVNERGNLTAQQRAAGAATPERPGQAGAARRGLPTPEELRNMDATEAFKSGAIDRLLTAIPGGLPPRRRAG